MTHSPKNSNEVATFAAHAKCYCDFIQSWSQGRPEKLYGPLELLLCNMHRSILPVRASNPGDDPPEEEELSHQQWETIAALIAETTSPEVSELIARHGEDIEEATRAFMLNDDLADIFRDLADGLAYWNQGNDASQANAAWQWRFTYEHHWGRHLFRAMTTVHEIRYDLFVE